MIDWDDAFDNSGYVPESADLIEGFARDAAAYRKALGPLAELDVPYGDRPRERLDIFHSDNAAKGLLIFVHGGYWLRLDRSYWSHLAQGAVAHGWSVAMPSYPLAPEARISEITASIAKAVTHLASKVEGPIRLAGHSAGGHLVSRMACQGVLPATITDRIARVTSMSGVHHLSPLLMTKMNETLRLDEAEATAESPITHDPVPTIPITFWVGDQERPEFLRQTRIAAETWALKGANISTVYEPGTNHFTLIQSLADPNGAMTQEVLR